MTGSRFPRERRLTGTADFARVRREGQVVRGKFLSIGFAFLPEDRLRAGFITSRRVGNAVARNRVRRRLREIFRRHQSQIKTPCHLVTIATSQAARATYIELEHEWLRLARRTSILAP